MPAPQSETAASRAPTAQSLRRLRAATLAALVLYPTGALLQLLPQTVSLPGIAGLIGVLLCVIAFGGFLMVLFSDFYRITFVGAPDLDEREIAQRADAMLGAYICLGLITVLGLFYFMMAGVVTEGWNIALWTPSTGGEWQTILFGAVIYVMILPASFLIWRARPLDPQD